MADRFSNLITVLRYLVIMGAFGSLFWMLVSLWEQLLSPTKICAECKEIFVWKRDKRQILCNKCQDFVGIRKGAMGP